MAKKSAGILLFRESSGHLEVLLVHPGGPFWAKREDGAWSIPKGEFDVGEEPLAAAKRELSEEIDLAVAGEPIPLGALRQPSGKVVSAWAVRGDFDPARLRSNMFAMEWPPRSGRRQEFPEVDRAAWLTMEGARRKIIKGQLRFLDLLQRMIRDPCCERAPAASPDHEDEGQLSASRSTS
jgi:predicted NUDIX family NTP pyrophosphohydrolase